MYHVVVGGVIVEVAVMEVEVGYSVIVTVVVAVVHTDEVAVVVLVLCIVKYV